MMKPWSAITGAIAAILLLASASLADVPRKINYQGYLTNPGGAPLTGTYTMIFSLCGAASGGTCPWSESRSVAVDKGIFNVALGAVTPITLPFDAPYFLDIQVNGEQMSARQALTSVGYAYTADTAATAATATSFSGSLSGDVTGTQGTTVVSAVGGQSAASVASGVSEANSATTSSFPGSIVKRDLAGNFSAGTITASLSGNASTATALAANGTNCPAGQYSLGVDASGNVEGCTTAGGGADTTPPVPGNSGTLTATNSGTDIVLSWTAATDTVTPQANLEYAVFYSTTNNIDTVAKAEANGTVSGFPWSTNLTSRTISGLTVGTTYFFNVVVKDAGHNNSIYTTVSKAPSVPTGNIVLFRQGTTPKANYGGRSGADALCNASGNKPAGYTNFAAFLSVNATDTIAGRQAFSGLDTARAIRSSTGELIANNWADMLDGTIVTPLSSAGSLLSGGFWFSGSNADGTLGQTCNGWTVGANGTGALGDWGNGGSSDATWIVNTSSRDYCGDTTTDLLCIAW